ncbi:MAG: TRL-like protein family [Candidatus Sumerlaeota bacterium]|nr:TRL-like protein family [Candidatus Sumerlaeota bacterium]
MKPNRRGIVANCCLTLLFSAVLLCLGGCAFLSAPVQPPTGLVFTSVQAPVSADYDATVVRSEDEKHAQATSYFFFEPLITRLSFGWDDVAIAKIAQDGGIKEVHYADYEFMHVLGIFAKVTISVYGE